MTVALVTGGTQGIGLATGLELARAGARVVLTYKWGSVADDEVLARFAAESLPAPTLVRADVADEADTAALLADLDAVDIVVSNVAFAPKITSLDDWHKRDLVRAFEYTTWPLYALPRAVHDRFGRWPRYVVGMSSDGPDQLFAHYDFVAIAKAALETMARYLAWHLGPHGTTVNIVRSRLVRTASFDATFGPEHAALLDELGFGDAWTTPDEVARVVRALTSGWMDAVTGQVLMVDRGFRFYDSSMGVAARRAQLKE